MCFLITIDHASKRAAYEIIEEEKKEKKKKRRREEADQSMMGYPFDACLSMEKTRK